MAELAKHKYAFPAMISMLQLIQLHALGKVISTTGRGKTSPPTPSGLKMGSSKAGVMPRTLASRTSTVTPCSNNVVKNMFKAAAIRLSNGPMVMGTSRRSKVYIPSLII
jgi:hypothetical protein